MNCFIPDALFPCDNEWGIPTLYLPLQADFVDAPLRGWGSVRRKSAMRGTWHFYTDDYKFTAIWKKPDELITTKAVAAVEVNYTTDDQMSRAVCLYRIYQKRWLARYWQTQGYRIFVDLNVAPQCAELNMIGVPKGWRAYATSAADNAVDDLKRHAEVAFRRAGSEDILFLVYGGGPLVRQLCADHNWVNVQDARNAARSDDA